jgi:hypothetical protein
MRFAPRWNGWCATKKRVWHGWYRNHGGEVVFFGDHFGSNNATSALLVLLAIAVLWKMAQYVPRPPVAEAIPTRPRPRRKR